MCIRDREKLIATLDAAVVLGDDHTVTDALRRSLCDMIADQDIALPDCVLQPITDHYARRELYISPTHGYSCLLYTSRCV